MQHCVPPPSNLTLPRFQSTDFPNLLLQWGQSLSCCSCSCGLTHARAHTRSHMHTSAPSYLLLGQIARAHRLLTYWTPLWMLEFISLTHPSTWLNRLVVFMPRCNKGRSHTFSCLVFMFFVVKYSIVLSSGILRWEQHGALRMQDARKWAWGLTLPLCSGEWAGEEVPTITESGPPKPGIRRPDAFSSSLWRLRQITEFL